MGLGRSALLRAPLNDSRDDWAVYADALADRGDVRGDGIAAALMVTPRDKAAVWLPLCIDAAECQLDGYRCDGCSARVHDAAKRRAAFGNLAPLPPVTELTRRAYLRASLGGRSRHGRPARPALLYAPDAGDCAAHRFEFNRDGSLSGVVLDINAFRIPF